jgi:transposase
MRRLVSKGETSGMKKKSTARKQSKKGQAAPKKWTVGIDLGDRWSRYCVVDEEGEVIEEGRFKTTPEALRKHFAESEPMRIAIEAATHSLWVSEHLRQLGHEVLVANAREIRAITHSDSKCDQFDAEKLARYARVDPKILHPITHRSIEMQCSLNIIRARDVLVRMRTLAVNAVRGLVKPCGHRLPICSTESFAGRCRTDLPANLLDIAEPLLKQIELASEQITLCDRRIEELANKAYSETKALRKIPGVGTLTALTFVLTLADKGGSRRAATWVVISVFRPRRSQSGDSDPQLGITKAGDQYLRKLLVQSAHSVLGHYGPDSALRQWGLQICGRGGKNAKKRALIAVARKLSVLLHRLWVTQAEYIPFYEMEKKTA